MVFATHAVQNFYMKISGGIISGCSLDAVERIKRFYVNTSGKEHNHILMLLEMGRRPI